MLYLESLILHKFKSFKHAELLFSKGFTCVVGPNGSGKSNIMDAILIAFGESSMNRLRVEKEAGLGQLIHRNTPHAKLAYMTLNFAGDEKISVTKIIRNDGKTKYKVNGRRMTRKEVIEMLSKYNVRADETTTIAQEEISNYTKLNPKQRRELIDIAAGIKEFDYKKNESLKELDKVTQKVDLEQSVLHERLGFLKELEKDKETAEHYAQMSAKLKSLRFSILYLKKEEVKQAFESYTKSMALLDLKKNEALSKADELTKKIEQLNQEREHLTTEMNKSSSIMSETNAKREAVNKDLTKIEAEIISKKNTIMDSAKALDSEKAEAEQVSKGIKDNAETIGKLSREQSMKQSEFLALEQELGEDDLGKVAESFNKLIEEDEARLLDINLYIAKLQSEEAVLKSRQADANKRAAELNSGIAKTRDQRDLLSGDAAKGKVSMEKLSADTSKLENSEKSLNSRMEEIDTKLINTKEQLAVALSREGSSLAAKISDKFDEKDGFYGKASKLCTYDAKYGNAIETSAGNRFEYFVVDSIATANSIIRYLKENSLGRATFIPIEELKVESDKTKLAEATPIIEFVEFNKKLTKVFDYIFNNTYLVNSVEASKRLGIGKHRYVTLDGELIEQSGIISGGSQRRVSASRLENELASLAATKANLKEQLEENLKSLSSLRKEQSRLELSAGSSESEMRRLEHDAKEYERNLGLTTQELNGIGTQLTKIGDELVQSDKDRMEIVSKLAANKSSLKEQISKSAKMSKSAKLTGRYNKDVEKAKALTDELQKLGIRAAELQKENQLFEKRSEALTNSIKEKEKLLKETKADLNEKAIRKEVLDKARVDIEYAITHSNESNRKGITRISDLGKELEVLGGNKGKILSEAQNIEHQISDIQVERGKSETKFHDISAELASYGQGMALVKGKVDEMESESNILSANITALGNVNMKAPELYAQKKQLVDEAQSKLNTLDTEKNAVLRMINEIDSRKMQSFLDTLNEINKNFMKLYNYIFPGKATLMLEDPKDPLNSGLKVQINNGDIEQSVTSKSGGERAFISMMLLFAIHSCKPSSLYIFDEIDKSLDKENSKKLSLLIKQMSKDAQFIVITHNDALIINADVAIGVTKVDEASKAVGLDISKITNNNKQ